MNYIWNWWVNNMIKIENVEVNGWRASIRGMRNPMNSWHLSDTVYDSVVPAIGENDIRLMQKLAKAGSDHRKFTRMLIATVDITAPLYWWKEFDTYRAGVEQNGCSTMHKIHNKEFTLDDFSHEHLFDGINNCESQSNDMEYYENPTLALEYIISVLNYYRKKYIETKDKKSWWQMIQLLPSSYNQKRTKQISYEALYNMYCARRKHKLDEWVEFCEWIETLPYFKDIFQIDNKQYKTEYTVIPTKEYEMLLEKTKSV